MTCSAIVLRLFFPDWLLENLTAEMHMVDSRWIQLAGRRINVSVPDCKHCLGEDHLTVSVEVKTAMYGDDTTVAAVHGICFQYREYSESNVDQALQSHHVATPGKRL